MVGEGRKNYFLISSFWVGSNPRREVQLAWFVHKNRGLTDENVNISQTAGQRRSIATVFKSAEEAVADIKDGQTLCVFPTTFRTLFCFHWFLVVSGRAWGSINFSLGFNFNFSSENNHWFVKDYLTKSVTGAEKSLSWLFFAPGSLIHTI
jgi:hypothetical protein